MRFLVVAAADRSLRYPGARVYYSLKRRIIDRSYPAYAPGREPARHKEWLKQQEPEDWRLLYRRFWS